jgi:hypothetical protein
VQHTLYYYTEVFDIVIDPMVGSGTTIDVCKLMLRRHLTDDQRATMAAKWKEESKRSRGQASPQYGKSAPRSAEMDRYSSRLQAWVAGCVVKIEMK